MVFTFMALPSHGPEPGSGSDPADHRESLPEYLEPIVAGARARGVADAFELLGIEAILIDAAGRVLHASRNAADLLAPRAKIVDGRLLGCDLGTDQAVQRLIAAALAPSEAPDAADEIVIGQGGEPSPLRIKIIRYPTGQPDRYQLLRAVLAVAPSEG